MRRRERDTVEAHNDRRHFSAVIIQTVIQTISQVQNADNAITASPNADSAPCDLASSDKGHIRMYTEAMCGTEGGIKIILHHTQSSASAITR